MQEVEPTGLVVDMGNVHEKNVAKCGGFPPCVHPPNDGSDEGRGVSKCEGVVGVGNVKCQGEKGFLLEGNTRVDNNNREDKESAHVDVKDAKAREESVVDNSATACSDQEGSVEQTEVSSEVKQLLKQEAGNMLREQASIELVEGNSDRLCSNSNSLTETGKESVIYDASVPEDRTNINDLLNRTDDTVLSDNSAVAANYPLESPVVGAGSAEDEMLNSTKSTPIIRLINSTQDCENNLTDSEGCALSNNECVEDLTECNLDDTGNSKHAYDGRLEMSPEQSSDSVDSEQDGNGCPQSDVNSVEPSDALCSDGFNTEGCSGFLDPNIQFDEDMNPSSLPFESLNSSFQYSVLIDSCSEDENEDNSSFTNPSDGEFGGTADKLRMAFGSEGGADSLDFLSTEAENQLECCDQWSLGSCSLGGYECRTLEKRRRSLETRDEDGRLVTCDISKLGISMTVVKEDRFDCASIDEEILAKDVDSSTNSVNTSDNLSEQCAISLVKECENESIHDSVTQNLNSADVSPSSAVLMACGEGIGGESFVIPEASGSVMTRDNLDVSTAVVCNNVNDICHTIDDRETDEQAVTTTTATSNDSLPSNVSTTHSSSPAVNTPGGDCTIVASADSDNSCTKASDVSHETTNPPDGGTDSIASGGVSDNQALEVTSLPARGTSSGDPFRRCSAMQPCTVMLPPPIDEEPDVLLEEGADLSTFVKDSRSSHSSGHSGHTVGGDDDFPEDKSMSTNDRIYESVQQSDHLTSNKDTPDTIIPDHEPNKIKSEAPLLSTTKPELRSYLGKSMLPGLSGLHGLSSLRHSAHNLSKTTLHSSSQNRASTGDTCLESRNSKPSENGGIHESTKVSPCTAANGSNSEEIAWVSRRLQAHRQLSSSDSWGSEDFESYSSNEEDSGVGKEDGGVVKPCEVSMTSSKLSTDSKVSVDSNCTVGTSSSGVVSSAGREKLKARLLRKREQWRERRQSSSKEFRLVGGRKDSREGCDGPLREGSIEDVHTGSGGADTGKLSRWFSLRKSVNYDVDRKPGTLTTPSGTLGSTHPLPNRLLPKSLSENDGSNIPSNDLYPNGVPNSSTLSSISSFSSNSSSSTSSSSSSFPHHHNNSHHNNLRMPQVLELEERMSELEASTYPSNFYRSSCGGLGALGANTFQRKHQPPSLPPIPPGLAPEQIKRRHIVASIVHSENNYVATLHRLVREYRKPLDDSKPPILSQAKVATLFHYVHEILQCHTMFRIALTDCVRHWDRDEKIGDVFFASFSKGVVLDIYSEFINNFTRAMELAKLESRKKSAFADYLKMRQITSPDRLSFFGMMVKPVQRFPQFILFLQDLLKHTPKGHHDRMSLQLALTQLESLAENLNEQKRESEQHQAFKATLKQINSKFALRNISEGNRCLIRQDDVTKLEFGPNGLIKQTKERRLFLTTDTVICVSVVPKTSDDFNSQNERLSLKWVHPITEIEVQESNSSLTLSRLLAAGLSQRSSSSSTTTSSALTKQHSTNSTTTGGGDSVYDIYNNMATTSLEESEAMVGAICAEMNDLMHDYQVVSRIAGLVGSLKGSYDGLNSSSLQGVMGVIQQNIQARDDRMSWLDGCCLQIRAGKEKEVITFHVQDPTVKKDWIIELRLAQLAVSSVNSPAWDSGDLSTQPPSRRPLFVTALPILHAAHHTQVVCGCQYPVQELPKSVPARGVLGAAGRRGGKTHTSVWLCSTDGVTSHITRYITHLGGLRECIRVSLREMCVTGMLHVPPAPLPLTSPGSSSPASPSPPPTAEGRPPLTLDTVWIGTLQNRLLVYSGSASDAQEELCSTDLPAAVSSLIYHCEQVFIGLTNGQLLVYQRGATDGCWQVSKPVSISLSDGAAVTALLPLSAQLYAAVAETVMVLDCVTLQIKKQLSVHHGQSVSLLAHSGIGLWVCEAGSSTVCLYHTESCRHLQDIDLAPCVTRLLGAGVASTPVIVTALVVSRGLLWVGTSVGVTLTLPLPRLQGVPIISGRPTLSYHAHTGPVTFLMTLMPPEYFVLPKKISDKTNLTDEKNSSIAETKQPDDDSGVSEGNSNDDACSTVGKKCSEAELRNMIRKASTLPRGFGGGGTLSVMHEGTLGEMAGNLDVGAAGSDDGEVMGLCGELLRHWGDEGTVPGGDAEAGDSLRRSDPSLSCISSTLDRRLRLRAGRPRSLDLSSASIDSKVSAATTSSGSEDGHTAVPSRQSTIHENLAHDPIPEGDLSRKNSAQESVGMAVSGTVCADEDAVTNEPELKDAEEPGNEATVENKLTPLSTGSNDSCLENPDSSRKMDEKICSEASETSKLTALKNPSEQVESAKESNVPPTSSESVCTTKSTSVRDGTEPKRRGSHRRSSSDVTQKSLSSSTSNLSSLYYDADVDIFDTTKSSSSSSSNPTKSLKRVNIEHTGQEEVSEKANTVDAGVKESIHPSRKASLTNTLNRNISTLSRSPTAKSYANGKGGAATTGRGGKEAEQPRTVLVLAGGQGYKCIREDTPTNGPPHNNTDAHILVWEMKL